MRVLWFSNCVLGNSTSKGSGSWLYAMSKLICNSVELVNATFSNVESVTFNDYHSFSEVLIPRSKMRGGIPDEKTIKSIQETIERLSPDIIHIWGLENCWSLLYAKGFIKGRVLIEIQGLMGPCHDSFWGGLDPKHVRKESFCIRDVVYPETRLSRVKEQFKRRSEQANFVLSRCAAISTQSRWVREQVQFLISSNCKIYNTLRPIRQNFWDAKPWEEHDGRTCRIFTSMSYYHPFKGVHVLILALPLIKKRYEKVILEIAGVEERDLVWYRQFSYIKYLQKLAQKLNVSDSLVFVGRLNASQIIEHLRLCDVFVNPSFVESFSASTAEALSLGVPSVVSFAGAMPDFSENKQVTLFYSPMDYVSCAAKIIELRDNKNKREELCNNSKKEIKEYCSASNVFKAQMAIYNDLLMTDL